MKYGCDQKYEIRVPHGWSYRAINVTCGSTAPDGGVNQCSVCESDPAKKPPSPWTEEDYGDDE
jgi:hypothetical protein